jgi:hypothetical protein
MADLNNDLFDEYGRPIVVVGTSTEDLTNKLVDQYGRPVKVVGV